MIPPPHPTYFSRDIYLTSFLLLQGRQIIDLKVSFEVSKHQVFFAFQDSPSLQHQILQYLSGSAGVEPLVFLEKIKRLRCLIRYSMKQDPKENAQGSSLDAGAWGNTLMSRLKHVEKKGGA